MTLFRSRKFWLMVLDVVLSAVAYFVAKYAGQDVSKDVIWMIGLLQPVFVALITGIAVEDAAEKGARIYTEEIK